MSHKSFLLLLIIVLPYILTAQNFSNEFGEITEADISFIEYEKDKDAEAVVIYDKGKSVFYNVGEDFHISLYRKTRIKILKEAGLEYAEIEIPFYKDESYKERVRAIEAFTYNFENGEIVKTKVEYDQIFEEKVTENWYIKKFAMPDVKIGSVIEFKYDHIKPNIWYLPDWEFQREIPTIFSQYIVRTIPFFDYMWRLQGVDNLHKQDSYVDHNLGRKFGPYDYNDIINIFEMKDVPSFKDESFISSKNDYILKVDFQLSQIHSLDGSTKDILTTWEDMVTDLLDHDHFGKYLKSCHNDFSSIVSKKNLLAIDEVERMKDIMNYVKSNFSWDGYNRKFASKSFREFEKEKQGNSAEINLFLSAAFNAAGIEAYPVIISTRDHGKIIKKYPFAHAFNYVIVWAKVKDKWSLYDATDSYCPNDRIPMKCINDVGLLIKKGKLNG
jgi:hypothetical protein